MHVLLINLTIRENRPPSAFPTGLALIAATARGAGHRVTVVDQDGTRMSDRRLLSELRRIAGGPEVDLVGLGGLITLYAALKRVLPAVAEIFPRAARVVGGGVTIEPELLFERLPVDYCVHGEGERTFAELCAALDDGQTDLRHVHGISFRGEEGIVRTPERGLEPDLDALPMPAYDLFPAERYFESNLIRNQMGIDRGSHRGATLLWSRGCPNRCTFCWRMSGPTYRFRSVDRVMEELRFLRERYDVDSYLFYDECINADAERVREFSDALRQGGLAAPWYSHARVVGFDDALARSLASSGCVGLNFGVESANREILKQMRKNATPDQAARAVAAARENLIIPMCSFILGMPGETRESVQDTVEWIWCNAVTHFTFFFATPYPGCDLYHSDEVQARIRSTYGSNESFFEALGDAQDLTLNISRFSDEELGELRRSAENSARRPPLRYRIRKLRSRTYRHDLPRRVIGRVRKGLGREG